jgi:hypothetical protein
VRSLVILISSLCDHFLLNINPFTDFPVNILFVGLSIMRHVTVAVLCSLLLWSLRFNVHAFLHKITLFHGYLSFSINIPSWAKHIFGYLQIVINLDVGFRYGSIPKSLYGLHAHGLGVGLGFTRDLALFGLFVRVQIDCCSNNSEHRARNDP